MPPFYKILFFTVLRKYPIFFAPRSGERAQKKKDRIRQTRQELEGNNRFPTYNGGPPLRSAKNIFFRWRARTVPSPTRR